ncbi:hypothetical protein HJ526_12110 [Donghicola sp. C2-DW-16]|uniref:Uncharacterized protein n=1 Tax=Donghicola mangrovi TaxID=2729614 RepID=A0ABX2PFA8_9RHOB|nr:plasmid recombination protein [Donghicola mangrovi]NVO28170.1 hypothetical protein [Donghicola mangrovi]
MSVQPRFENAEPIPSVADLYPIVLRFARLGTRALASFFMHDRRKGGDLAHIDTTKLTLNKVEHGAEDWLLKFNRRLKRFAKINQKREAKALLKRGRTGTAKKLMRTKPKLPWNANTNAPLREGILTVNKSWFGGAGVDAWDKDRVELFRVQAMEFLRQSFPGAQLLYAASHSDEEAFHIHFVVAVWTVKTSKARGKQILLQASENPLLNDYELAQDLAGAHFSDIGLRRGNRDAEARREAKARGETVPKKRRHISPSEYRADQLKKGIENAEVQRAVAKEDCAAALKKVRQRASSVERKARRKRRKAAKEIAALATETSSLRETTARLAADVKELDCEIASKREDLVALQQEGDAVIAQAKCDAEAIRADALQNGTKLIRKSRKKAIKDAKRKCAADEKRARQARKELEDAERKAAAAKRAELAAVFQRNAAQVALQNLVFKAGRYDAQINEAEATLRSLQAQMQTTSTRLRDLTQDILTAEEQLSASTRKHQVISDGVIAAQKAIWLLEKGDLLFDSTQRKLVYADDDPFLTQAQFDQITGILKRAEPILNPVVDMLHRANTALFQSVRKEHLDQAQLLSEIQDSMGIAQNADLEQVIAHLKQEDQAPQW